MCAEVKTKSKWAKSHAKLTLPMPNFHSPAPVYAPLSVSLHSIAQGRKITTAPLLAFTAP